jgi:mono/diheme cytochrome c family protein
MIADEGRKIYNTYCISCHQEDGSGDGNRYPPLAKSDWVRGDVNRLIMVLLEGLAGPITVNGDPYDDMMPKQDFLSNDEIAKVLSYIRLNFDNNSSAIHSSEVARLRHQVKAKQENVKGPD